MRAPDYNEAYDDHEVYVQYVGISGEAAKELVLGARATPPVLDLLRRLPKRGRLLDIGCGNGTFCRLAEELGYEVYACDVAEKAVQYARAVHRLRNTWVGTSRNLPAGWHEFDVVTCFEVLEHLEDPYGLERDVFGLLKPGGVHLCSVPNTHRLTARRGRRENTDYPPNHLTRWQRASLKQLLARAGFVDCAIAIPAPDSYEFRVALLPVWVTDWRNRRWWETEGRELYGADSPPSGLWSSEWGSQNTGRRTPAVLRSGTVWSGIKFAARGASALLNLLVPDLGNPLIALARKPLEPQRAHL